MQPKRPGQRQPQPQQTAVIEQMAQGGQAPEGALPTQPKLDTGNAGFVGGLIESLLGEPLQVRVAKMQREAALEEQTIGGFLKPMQMAAEQGNVELLSSLAANVKHPQVKTFIPGLMAVAQQRSGAFELQKKLQDQVITSMQEKIAAGASPNEVMRAYDPALIQGIFGADQAKLMDSVMQEQAQNMRTEQTTGAQIYIADQGLRGRMIAADASIYATNQRGEAARAQNAVDQEANRLAGERLKLDEKQFNMKVLGTIFGMGQKPPGSKGGPKTLSQPTPKRVVDVVTDPDGKKWEVTYDVQSPTDPQTGALTGKPPIRVEVGRKPADEGSEKKALNSAEKVPLVVQLEDGTIAEQLAFVQPVYNEDGTLSNEPPRTVPIGEPKPIPKAGEKGAAKARGYLIERTKKGADGSTIVQNVLVQPARLEDGSLDPNGKPVEQVMTEESSGPGYKFRPETIGAAEKTLLAASQVGKLTSELSTLVTDETIGVPASLERLSDNSKERLSKIVNAFVPLWSPDSDQAQTAYKRWKETASNKQVRLETLKTGLAFLVARLYNTTGTISNQDFNNALAQVQGNEWTTVNGMQAALRAIDDLARAKAEEAQGVLRGEVPVYRGIKELEAEQGIGVESGQAAPAPTAPAAAAAPVPTPTPINLPGGGQMVIESIEDMN